MSPGHYSSRVNRTFVGRGWSLRRGQTVEMGLELSARRPLEKSRRRSACAIAVYDGGTRRVPKMPPIGATGRFAKPEDDDSWIFPVLDGDEWCATSRVTWGGHGFSDRQMAQYELAPFLDDLPADVIAVAERLAVLPAYRGAGLFREDQWRQSSRSSVVVCGSSSVVARPHLLSLYLGKGRRRMPIATSMSPRSRLSDSTLATSFPMSRRCEASARHCPRRTGASRRTRARADPGHCSKPRPRPTRCLLGRDPPDPGDAPYPASFPRSTVHGRRSAQCIARSNIIECAGR